ncbi:MAG: clostripain-related cysteine peptidase [Terriglobia bacterium]
MKRKHKSCWMHFPIVLILAATALMAAPPQNPKEWTIMFYMAGGLDVAGDARKCLFNMKEVGSTQNVNLFAQFDTGSERTDTKQYKLTKLRNAKKIRDLIASVNPETEDNTQKALFAQILQLTSVDEDTVQNLLKTVEVKVGKKKQTLGDVLNQVLVTPESKKYFREKLRSEPARLQAANDPSWLKTYLLESILEGDTVNVIGPTKTGNPQVFSDFMNFALTNFPAKRKMIVIWGHGNGFSVASDSGTPSEDRDQLLPSEIRSAIRALNLGVPIDILGFNACQMDMVEILNHLKDIVGISIASEGNTPKESWPYDKILKKLRKNPQMDARELASTVVVEYIKSFNTLEDVPVDLSACDISEVQNVVSAIKHLTPLLLSLAVSSESTVRTKLVEVRNECKAYTSDLVDLSDFCQVLSAKFSDNASQGVAISPKCDQVIEAVQKLVVKQESQLRVNGKIVNRPRVSHGVSIYFPETGGIDPRFKNRLEIAGTRWAEFLESYQYVFAATPVD